jgi:thiol:disulfide interchange protein DsbD
VLRRAEQFAMLQADVTAMSPENERLLDRYRVLGVPTTIFYDRSGREQRRTVGYVPAEQFVALMDEAARGSSSVASARD